MTQFLDSLFLRKYRNYFYDAFLVIPLIRNYHEFFTFQFSCFFSLAMQWLSQQRVSAKNCFDAWHFPYEYCMQFRCLLISVQFYMFVETQFKRSFIIFFCSPYTIMCTRENCSFINRATNC